MNSGIKTLSKLTDLVRNDSMNLSPRELLQQSPRVLLGVSADARTVLQSLDIETVFDFATSSVFNDALKIVDAAIDFNSAISQHGAPTADMVRETEVAGKSIQELQYLSISALQKIPASESSTHAIQTALDVQTIRDLALYPPYQAALTLLNKIYFPENDIDYDPERPADLLPKSGEYPTERVQYTTLLLDEIPLDAGASVVDINSTTFTPIDLALLDATDSGFKKTAFGALVTFNQSWFVQGVTLGQLLHSAALAPGESTRIAIVDWSRRSRAGETEVIDEADDLTNDQSHNRSISEVTRAVADEAQGGFSATNTSSTSTQEAVSAAMEMSAPLGGLLGGPSGSMGVSSSTATSKSHADSYSSSWGHRELGTQMNQNVNDRTHQHAHSNRSRRASVVKEVSQSEHESVSTRVIANYNHMHALTVQYYEVVQIYRVQTSIVKADKVIFIPIALINFNDDKQIHRFQHVLTRVALSNEIREGLKAMEMCQIDVDKDSKLSSLSTSMVKFVDEALMSRTALNAMKASFVVLSAKSEESTAVNKAKAKSTKRVTPKYVVSILQHINEQVWNGSQVASLSKLLGTSVLRPGSNSLYLPADILVENALVDSARANIGTVFYNTNNQAIANVSTDAPVTLNALGRIALKGSDANQDVEATVTLTLNRNGVRFPVELPSVVIKKGFTGETKLVQITATGASVNLKKHLMDHRMYYSQAIFRTLSTTQIALLLSQYGVEVDIDGTATLVPVAQVVDPLPIRIIGNYLAFKMNTDPRHNLKWRDWLDLRGIKIGSTVEDLIPLGTGGVFAEAVLGRSNSAEKLDISRFWNWQDSPIPLQPSDIAAIQTGTRATNEDVKPGQLSNPIVNITSPTSLPDPTGTAAILSAIANGNMFRDMSGLQATIGLAQSALQASAAGASTAGEQAGTNMNNLLKANTERQRIAAEMITSLAKTAASAYTGGAVSPGGGISPSSNHSQDGAKINYFDKSKGESKPTTSGTGGSGSGTAPSTSGSTGSSGGSSGGTSTGGSGAVVPVSSTSGGSSGYSQNPAALAATWGDSKSRSEALDGIMDKASESLETPAGPPTWAIDFVWQDDVQLIAQTSNLNCWAACASIVSSWDTKTSVALKDTPPAVDIDEAANRYGLVLEPLMSHSIQSFIDILRSTGPQWACANQQFFGTPGFHAVVVTGIYSNGNPDGSDTFLYILDPWDRAPGTPGHPGAHLGTHNVGSRYSVSWAEFTRELEAAVGNDGWMWVRLMHATGTSLRLPSPGASTSPIT